MGHKKFVSVGYWFIELYQLMVNEKGMQTMCAPFCTNLIEIAKQCLWNCNFAMKMWKRFVTLLITIHPRVVYTQGVVLWVMVHDKPTIYEQENVADALVMRYGLM